MSSPAAFAITPLTEKGNRQADSITVQNDKSIVAKLVSLNIITTAQVMDLVRSQYNVPAKKPTPTTKDILDEIEESFEIALQAKTGWGRNDVIIVYNNCVNKILKELISKIIDQS